MTPAAICDACTGCRTIHECRRRSSAAPAPSPSAQRPWLSTPWLWFGDAVCTLAFLGFTALLLRAAGA